MEHLSVFQMTVISAALIFATLNLVNGQISTPCTTSLISTFTPCANFITGSTNNGVITPSNTCCDSIRSLMSTGMDCACLLLAANAPILPSYIISQALALSISQACNINGVSTQCKASGSPLPAPGPAILGSNGPTILPIAASPASPQGSVKVASKTMAEGVAETHKYENLQLAEAVAVTPASPPVEAEPPTKTPGLRPVLTPIPNSASHPSYVTFSPFALVLFVGINVFAAY